ncbi:MAG: NUDIX hydrolase [Sphaerochaeta sp.]|jgi:ADP-ribose pyrophosphatase|nr:NUDIX hydrolase [Sphaerochaeta sp.]
MVETVSKKTLLQGSFWSFTEEGVRLPDGTVREYHLLNHPGGVAVLAINGEGKIALEKQYRYAMGKECIEIPAGKRDKGPESPEAGARRELQEETGCTANTMLPLGEVYPSPGMVTEKLFLFLATGLTQGERHLDDDEFIQVMWKTPAEVQSMILDGTVKDAKTICAFFLAKAKGLISLS